MSGAPGQYVRGAEFAALHRGPDAFVVPNPWDAGTARVLAGLGFTALATTSGGAAHALGRPDGAGQVQREEALDNVRAIAEATALPVSADLGNGFGDTPEDAAESVLGAARVGAVGGSIEDATGRADDPIHAFEDAVQRVEAAAQAAVSLPFPFTLTARAENFLYGRPDLDDTIARLRAYEQAGADVLYAPALPDAEAIRTVCASVSRPVNVLAVGAARELSVPELARLGARRISLGSTLSRAALSTVVHAARQIVETGTFPKTDGVLSGTEVDEVLGLS